MDLLVPSASVGGNNFIFKFRLNKSFSRYGLIDLNCFSFNYFLNYLISFAERLRVRLAVIHGKGLHPSEHDFDDGRNSPPPEDEGEPSPKPWDIQNDSNDSGSRTNSAGNPNIMRIRGTGDGDKIRHRSASGNCCSLDN